MAGHQLIGAHLDALARRLPADIVDELTDGLTETFQRRLDQGLTAETAARSAIAEFGTVDAIVTEFVQQAPGRRTARTLLASGPVVGASWAVAAVTGQAWTWPTPEPIRAAFGATLMAVVAALALAATARHSYRRTRITALAGLGLLLLDASALSCVALTSPNATVALNIAVAASLIRVCLTIRALRRLHAP